MDHPEINKNVHPPLVALSFIVLAYLLGWLVHLPWAMPPILRYSGFTLMVIGFVFAFSAFNEFRKAHTTLDPHGSVSNVVTTGIYRFTRNPIYTGFLLVLIGLPLYSGHIWGAVLAPFFIMTMNRLVIEREEAYLEEKFGEPYAGYRSRVKRWL